MATLTNENFMEIVRQYPVLYDRFSKDFKDKVKKENAWSKVAEATGLSVEECSRKYKNIRTNYVRNWKKRKPSGSGRGSDDSENSQKCYRWLDTFIEHRKTLTNLPSCQSFRTLSPLGTTSDGESTSLSEYPSLENDSSLIHDGIEDGEEDNDSFENVSNITVSPSPETTSSLENNQHGTKRSTSDVENGQNNRPWAKGSKRVKKTDVDNAFLRTINNFEKSFSSHVNNKSQEDEDSLFCKSLVAQIRRLPPERKGIAKCQILQMLQSFEFGIPSTAGATSSFFRPPSTVNAPLVQDEFGAPSSFHTFHQARSRDFPTYQQL